jgi:hypothetical protein
MGGCSICKDPAVSGPNCDGCRPAPCRNPDLSHCATQCDSHFDRYWCELCRTATEKASSIIETLGEVYLTEKEVEKAITAASIACVFLTPFVAVGCEFVLTTFVERGVIKFAVGWLFKEAANQMIARDFCTLVHACSGPGGALAMNPLNSTIIARSGINNNNYYKYGK